GFNFFITRPCEQMQWLEHSRRPVVPTSRRFRTSFWPVSPGQRREDRATKLRISAASPHQSNFDAGRKLSSLAIERKEGKARCKYRFDGVSQCRKKMI